MASASPVAAAAMALTVINDLVEHLPDVLVRPLAVPALALALTSTASSPRSSSALASRGC